MKTAAWRAFVYLVPFGLAGCISTTVNPTVAAYPGPNKSPQMFAADQSQCRQIAEQQIAATRNEVFAPIAEAMRQEDEGGPVVPDSVVTGAVASLQEPYNQAYAQCMYAAGNIVPGYVPPVVQSAPREPIHQRRHKYRRASPRKHQPATGQAFVEPSAPASFAEPPPAK